VEIGQLVNTAFPAEIADRETRVTFTQNLDDWSFGEARRPHASLSFDQESLLLPCLAGGQLTAKQ